MAANRRTKVVHFVSYAHVDQARVDELLTSLDIQMKPSRRYDHLLWQDKGRLLLGKGWDREIKKALKACDYGLLLISPGFLGSGFVTNVELPRFVSGRKPCVPVLLAPVDFDLHEAFGLERLEYFALPVGRNGVKKAFADCVGIQKRRFCEQLHRAIELRLNDDGGSV
jgi:hypothetical protein